MEAKDMNQTRSTLKRNILLEVCCGSADDVIEAWKAGNLELAQERQNFSQEVINVICHYRGNIVGGKRIMKLMGFDLGPNRVPFRNMTPEEEASMKAELDAIGFFERCNKF